MEVIVNFKIKVVQLGRARPGLLLTHVSDSRDYKSAELEPIESNLYRSWVNSVRSLIKRGRLLWEATRAISDGTGLRPFMHKLVRRLVQN